MEFLTIYLYYLLSFIYILKPPPRDRISEQQTCLKVRGNQFSQQLLLMAMNSEARKCDWTPNGKFAGWLANLYTQNWSIRNLFRSPTRGIPRWLSLQ